MCCSKCASSYLRLRYRRFGRPFTVKKSGVFFAQATQACMQSAMICLHACDDFEGGAMILIAVQIAVAWFLLHGCFAVQSAVG